MGRFQEMLELDATSYQVLLGQSMFQRGYNTDVIKNKEKSYKKHVYTLLLQYKKHKYGPVNRV